MKKLLAFALALLFILAFAACGGKNGAKTDGKTDPNALTEDEQLLVDLLITISKDFYNPSEVRLLEVGDYRVYDASEYSGMGDAMYYGIKVKLQGENKLGGTLNHPYLIRIKTEGFSQAAIEAATKHFDDSLDYWQKSWDNCAEDEYPRSRYSTFEEYREHMIQFFLDNYFFDDEASARAAAEKDFNDSLEYWQESWDNSAEDEYPRKYYDSFEKYREGLIESELGRYFYPYPKEIVLDRSGCYKELSDYDTIDVDAESTFNVSKINKALKAYWDDRLGN